MQRFLLLIAFLIVATTGCDPSSVDGPSTALPESVASDHVTDTDSHTDGSSSDRTTRDLAELRKQIDSLTMRVVDALRNQDVAALNDLALHGFDAKERSEYLHFRLGKGNPKFKNIRSDAQGVTVVYFLDIAPPGQPPIYAHELHLNFREHNGSYLLSDVSTAGW